jgi:UDP-GlcNAc3NAcA epimerase
MKRVLSIVGARPQFIKAAAVLRAIAKANREGERLRHRLLHTGQHYDENMSAVFFRELEIPAADHNLGVRAASHGEMTARMLEGIERVLLEERPDIVLVYGDTNSTLAGALAAVKLHVPVAHVEAGLRSFNMRMPEEVNRIVADCLSQWLLCPTSTAQQNLLREGVEPARIRLVGDVMYDALLHYAGRAPRGAVGGRYCVATVHRAENTDDPRRLGAILSAVDEVSKEAPVIVPIHPRTRARLAQFGLAPARARLVDPVGYLEMIGLVRDCEVVLTDSGGLQKEAYFLRKPCVTMREETEWVELVELGVNRLAGHDPDRIVAAWRDLLRGAHAWSANPYGAGDAAHRIVATLLATV